MIRKVVPFVVFSTIALK